MSMSISQTVLVVDDDQPVRDAVSKALVTKGYEVISARNGREALKLISEMPVDAILVDIAMPEMDGVELMRRLRVASPETVVLVLTAVPDRAGYIGPTAVALGAVAVLRKPVHVDDLAQTLEAALVAHAIGEEV